MGPSQNRCSGEPLQEYRVGRVREAPVALRRVSREASCSESMSPEPLWEHTLGCRRVASERFLGASWEASGTYW